MATQSVKDILNSEVPSPSWAVRPTTADPTGGRITHSRANGEARSLNAKLQRFENLNQGSPRIWGPRQGLLMEPGSTNQIVESSNINPNDTGWTGNSVSQVTNVGTSAIVGGDAHAIHAYNLNKKAGNYTSGREVMSLIVERDISNEIAIRAGGGSSQFNIAELRYRFDTREIITPTDYGAEVYRQAIPLGEGSSTGEMVWLVLCYNASKVGESGATRQFYIFPSEDGTKTTLVHAQIEERGAVTSPIRTTPSTGTVTRPNEAFTRFSGGRPDWFSWRGGTYFYEARILAGASTGYGDLHSLNGIGDSFEVRDKPDLFQIGFFNESNSTFEVVQTLDAGPKVQRFAFTWSRERGIGMANNGVGQYSSYSPDMFNVFEDSYRSPDSIVIYSHTFIPQYLPPTDAQKRPSDPITLETLTV